MTKHTPGPWTKTPISGGWYIRGGGKIIARFWQSPSHPNSEHLEAMANGDVMTAAPLMLAALKQVCGACEELGWDVAGEGCVYMLNIMREAIAAAEPRGAGQ
jgi:hypothetical protein